MGNNVYFFFSLNVHSADLRVKSTIQNTTNSILNTIFFCFQVKLQLWVSPWLSSSPLYYYGRFSSKNETYDGIIDCKYTHRLWISILYSSTNATISSKYRLFSSKNLQVIAPHSTFEFVGIKSVTCKKSKSCFFFFILYFNQWEKTKLNWTELCAFYSDRFVSFQ